MKTIGVVTGSRADYGIYRPVLRRIAAERDLELRLFVTGSHLVEKHGLTVTDIKEDGFDVAACVECGPLSDMPSAFARAVGEEICAFADVFDRTRPDILLVLGDRYEMHAAVCAAQHFLMPVAHIHGGEITEGALDESFRHSITKMSHIHFPAAEEYGARIIRMGEEPWRVTVSGAPGLDNLRSVEFMSDGELAESIGMPLDRPLLMVTFHPATLEYRNSGRHAMELFSALMELKMPTLITAPNSDMGSDDILKAIDWYIAAGPNCRFIKNLGTRRYFSLMKRVAAMVGNSSSGIIEAASFELPVVNVGDRQYGRVRGKNVIDVKCEKTLVMQGVRKAVSPEFRKTLSGMKNPYGDGHAAERIVERLRELSIDGKLVRKKFYDG